MAKSCWQAKYISDESVVVDKNVITAQTPGDLVAWTLAIIDGIVASDCHTK